MESLGGRWDTEAAERSLAAMRGRLLALEGELAPLRAAVGAARHPWGWAFGGGLVAGVALVLWAWTRFGVEVAVVLNMAALAGLVWIWRRRRAADAVLEGARGELDRRLLDDVLRAGRLPVAAGDLRPWEEAGFVGRWEDVRVLQRLRHRGRELIRATLTREETTTTTDSQGNTRTETRTVTVFDGLLFALPFPDVPGEEVVVLAGRRGRPRPDGRFARRDAGGRTRGLERMEPASPTFNRRHGLWTDDPVTGHLVLDPDRVMRILNLHDDIAGMLGERRVELRALITEGRMWVAMPGRRELRVEDFPEGRKLEAVLAESQAALSIPAIVAHHLRLPHDLPNDETQA